MVQRIQGKSACTNGCIIPQPMADKGVRRLVKWDGNQNNNSPQKILHNLIRRKQAVQNKHHPIKISSYYIVQNGAKQAPNTFTEGDAGRISVKRRFSQNKFNFFVQRACNFRKYSL